jgi:hypothetical protein
MRKAILMGVLAILAANGLMMLGWPEAWYRLVPTAPHTGPFNPHFVRDIGCAYLASAAGLAFFARDQARGRSGALTATAFLLLHALVHVWDVASGRSDLHHLAQDFVGVALLPFVALWLILTNSRARAAVH